MWRFHTQVQEQTVPVLQPDCFEAGNGERSLSEIVKFRQRHMDGEAPGRRIHVDKIPTKYEKWHHCYFLNTESMTLVVFHEEIDMFVRFLHRSCYVAP